MHALAAVCAHVKLTWLAVIVCAEICHSVVYYDVTCYDSWSCVVARCDMVRHCMACDVKVVHATLSLSLALYIYIYIYRERER